MSEIIITRTVYPKNYCKYEHIMCELANDRGYCVRTGCTKQIIINEVPKVNKNLVEVVRCRDCKYWNTNGIGICKLHDIRPTPLIMDNWFCADGERKYGE